MLSHWVSVEQIVDFIRESLEKSTIFFLIVLHYSVIDDGVATFDLTIF